MNKQKIAASIIFIFSIFLMVSCSNEPVDPTLAAQIATNNSSTSTGGGTGNGSTGGGTTTPLNGNASLAIDGASITANDITAIKTRQSTPAGDFITYSVTISNVDNSNPLNSKIVILQFGNSTGNATYNLPIDSNVGVGTGISYIPDVTNPFNIYTSIDTTNPGGTTGTVNITSNDLVARKFSGNFNGTIFLNDLVTHTLLGTKSISNGVFTSVHYKISNDPSHFVVNLNGIGYANTSAASTTSFENNTIVIDAQDDSSNNDVILVIDNTTPIGTYNITNTSSATTVKGEYVSNGTSLLAQSGSITITSKTANKIVGTFSFTTSGSNSFTQGTFDLEY